MKDNCDMAMKTTRLVRLVLSKQYPTLNSTPGSFHIANQPFCWRAERPESLAGQKISKLSWRQLCMDENKATCSEVLNCAYNHNYVEEQYINKITELSCRKDGTGNLFSFPSSLFHAQVHPVVIPSVVNTRIFASLRRWQHLPAQHDTSIEFSHGRCFPNDALPGQSALMKIWGLLLWC